MLERARRIDRERRIVAERQRQGTDAHSGVQGSSLVVRKREIVRENCMSGLTTGRPMRVRYRDGIAHAAGTHDGAKVSLDKQVGRRQGKAIR